MARAERPTGVFGGGAWPVGRVAGIQLAVDHTWIFIFLLVTLSLRAQLAMAHEGWSTLSAWSTATVTSAFFFGSILLHELGHSLVAQRVGVRVRSITLFIFGGLAQLESEPRRPRDEVLIALAGPAVSVSLGAVFVLGARLVPTGAELGEAVAAALAWLGRINLIVAGFNVVPGFPLDGGRVLRGILWRITGSFERATAIAALNGSLFAYALIGIGIFTALMARQLLSGLWFVFIGWFLLSAARATVGQMVLERILASVRVRDAMEPVRDACVSGAVILEELVSDAVLRHGLRTFYVVDVDGRLRGILTLRELARVPADERPRLRAEEVMVPLAELEVLSAGDDGWVALKRMTERRVNQLPVLEEGRLMGAVTRERLLALVQVKLALGPSD